MSARPVVSAQLRSASLQKAGDPLTGKAGVA
jgi:hypothetical protein